MKPGRAVILVMVLGAAIGTAHGDLIIVGVEGIVQQSSLDGIEAGGTMLGYCVYDTSKPDVLPEVWRGKYELDSIVMTVGEYRFEHSPGAEAAWFSVWTTDVTYLAETNRGSMARDGQIVGGPTLRIKLIDLCNHRVSGPDAFPLGFPDIDFFSYRNEWHVYSGTHQLVAGKLTAIYVIPEPASVCLLLAGAVWLRKRARLNLRRG